MNRVKYNKRPPSKVMLTSFKAAPARILYNVITSNKFFKISNLRKTYFNLPNREKAVFQVKRSNVHQNYNEFYASSVLDFLDNLKASKKYEDLEIIVDTPKK